MGFYIQQSYTKNQYQNLYMSSVKHGEYYLTIRNAVRINEIMFISGLPLPPNLHFLKLILSSTSIQFKLLEVLQINAWQKQTNNNINISSLP